MNRLAAFLIALVGAVALAGCAGMRTVASDVSSFGEWPAGRKPSTYAFDRLPSQQARPEATARIEQAAQPALAKAGFTPVAQGQEPDILVQVGARATRTDSRPWEDPIWWRGGNGFWRYGPWMGPSWSLSARLDMTQRVESEVGILLRDRASGKPLFEARARHEQLTEADDATLRAMFEAAMMDFPRLGLNPRRVVVTVGP